MKNIKIYFTSDMHGFVYPTDYTNNELKALGILNIINSFSKDDNTLIIDGGDTIQGSPFTTYLSSVEFNEHPLAKVINKGNYDYITLGNHDFNYGYSYLEKYLNGINAKCICANVKDTTNKLPIVPYDMKILGNGIKVGIIGLTTEFINVWEKPQNLVHFEISDTLKAFDKAYFELKDKVDLLIAVYHGGFEKDLETHKSLSITRENIAYELCEKYDLDLLLTGHQHMPIKGEMLHGTYIVQTPHNGQQYSEINIQIDNNEMKIASELKTPLINPDTETYNELMMYEENVQEWLDSPVGYLDVALNPSSHLDMALNGSPLANFINTIQLEVSGADIACTSFANSIKGFNKDVTVRDIVSTYIYPNTLVVLEVSGEILKKALNRTGEYFSLVDGEVIISDLFLKPKVEHYNYDYYSNIQYEYKLNNNDKNTLVSVKFNGKEINDNEKYSLVMNNYRASGAGGYDFFKDCKILKEVQIEMTEIIIDYFKKHKNVIVDKKKYYVVER